MKKLSAIVLITALSVVMAFGFAACDPAPDESAVNLMALSSGADVVARDDVDYFVVPEPAASARKKAAGFEFVGDLQQLYGGDNGYPQAVVVAKNALFESDALSHFAAALTENAEWLANASTSISDIVGAVTSHLTPEMSGTFNNNNLTKEVIAHCGIDFVAANECKDETKSFLTELKAVQPAVNDSPADSFFWNGSLPQTESALSGIKVFAPDGAPALALAGLMAGAVDTSDVATDIYYEIVDAQTIQTKVTGETPAADICILPVNLAANLLGTGAKYKMLGTVTHGNLFILSAKTNEQITADNISTLKGKTVGVVNLAAVPGLTFKLILKKYGITYSDPAQQ